MHIQLVFLAEQGNVLIYPPPPPSRSPTHRKMTTALFIHKSIHGYYSTRRPLQPTHQYWQQDVSHVDKECPCTEAQGDGQKHQVAVDVRLLRQFDSRGQQRPVGGGKHHLQIYHKMFEQLAGEAREKRCPNLALFPVSTPQLFLHREKKKSWRVETGNKASPK